MLLADSGTGKTSFLLNYYSRWWRSRKHNQFRLSLIPLNLPNADESIQRIPLEDRSATALCLDALDEDRQAIGNHNERLSRLLDVARGFRTVIVTCRTQFFPKNEEIPSDTRILKIGPVGPNESRVFSIQKLYLSPAGGGPFAGAERGFSRQTFEVRGAGGLRHFRGWGATSRNILLVDSRCGIARARQEARRGGWQGDRRGGARNAGLRDAGCRFRKNEPHFRYEVTKELSSSLQMRRARSSRRTESSFLNS